MRQRWSDVKRNWEKDERILWMDFSLPSDRRTSFTSAEMATWEPRKGLINETTLNKRTKSNRTLQWSKHLNTHTDAHSNDKSNVQSFTLDGPAHPVLVLHYPHYFQLFSSLSSPHFYVCIILIIQSNQSILLSLWLAVGAAILLSLCSVIALWQGMMASAEPFHLTLGVYQAEPSLRSPLSLCTRLARPAWCPSYNFAVQTAKEREKGSFCAPMCERDVDSEVCAL